MKIRIRKPSASFLANYATALAAKQSPKVPTPPPPVQPILEPPTRSEIPFPNGEDNPSESFPPVELGVLSIKLSPGKNKYFIPLSNTRTHARPTHLIVIRECGQPMQTVRHIAEAYHVPEGAITLADIIGPEHSPADPFCKMFTPAYIFHSETETLKAVKALLPEVVEYL